MSALLFLALAVGTGEPSLTCDRPRIDRGEARGGPPLVQRFTLTNHGPVTLALSAARGSCGCLEPRLSRAELPPGESADLELEVNTLTQGPGPHCWHVHVGYSPVGAGPDPTAAGDLELELLARLTGEVTVEPASLRLVIGSGVTHTLALTDRRPTPLNLTGVSATGPGLRAELAGPWRSVNGAWVRTVRLEAAGEGPAGHLDAAVLLTSDDPEYRLLKVPVSMERRPSGVSAAPATVHFSPEPGRPTPAVLIYLRDAAGRPVRVASAECASPAVECRWADGPDTWATLRLRLVGDRPPAGPTSVRVRLREPAGDEVTVPVSVGGP
jgi:hypothetical protein